MDITIQSQNEQLVMNRTDYAVRVYHEGPTPSRKDLRKALAKEVKGKEDLLIVRRINGVFGDSASIVELSAYKDEKSMKEFEPSYMAARHAAEGPGEQEGEQDAAEKDSPDEGGSADEAGDSEESGEDDAEKKEGDE